MARKKGDGVAAPAAQQAVAQPQAAIPFEWAVNIVKLNRAIAYVRASKRDLKEKTPEFEEAVKARYVEYAGLLTGDKPTVTGKKAPQSNVVNMADDDGSPDDDE